MHTDQGDIACEMVVNAAGMWGMEIGRMAGVRIPAVAVEHQYILTGPIADFTPAELRQMPTMRDPDLLVYYKPDVWWVATTGHVPFGHVGIPAVSTTTVGNWLTASGSCHPGRQRTPVPDGRHPHDDQRSDPLLGRCRFRDGQGSGSTTTRGHRILYGIAAGGAPAR